MYDFTITRADLRFFSPSVAPRQLPHQREPLTWKPLPFIIQLHFTDDANAGGQGRPPLRIRVNKQSDKLKFTDFRPVSQSCRRDASPGASGGEAEWVGITEIDKDM